MHFFPPFMTLDVYLMELISPMWVWRSRQRYKIPPPYLPLLTFSFSTLPSPAPTPSLIVSTTLPSFLCHFLISSSLPSSPHPLPHTSRGGLVAAFLWVIVGSNPHALHKHWSELGLSDLRSELRNINERLSQHKQNWMQFLCLSPTKRHTDGFVTVWCNEW